MSKTEGYKDKTFTVTDPDARIRKASDLTQFEQYKAGDPLPPGAAVGDFKRIAKNTKVRVDQIKILPTGSKRSIVFAHAMSAGGGTELGWTSTRNFEGRFINETLREVPPPAGTGRFGPNAAWSKGSFIGQRTLVDIVDAGLEIERIALDTLDAYLGLVDAAARDDVTVAINSGFRSYPEQKVLYEGFVKGLPGFNLAAKPGRSNHQNGIAFDIAVPGGAGNPIYDWLTKNAPRHGFVRTVNKEPWHWEFDRPKADAAIAKGTFKTSGVTI
jgi:hypothetical protein